MHQVFRACQVKAVMWSGYECDSYMEGGWDGRGYIHI